MTTDNCNIAIAASIIAKQYNPQYGISLEEIANFLLSEMDNCEDGHEGEFASDFGKPYINGKLNETAFEKWLAYYTEADELNHYDRIEDFLTRN